MKLDPVAPVLPALSSRVQRELADTLLQSNWASPIGAFVLSLGLWGICYYTLREPVAWMWGVVMHITQVHRLLYAWRYVKKPADQREPLASAAWYCNSLLVSSLIWGLAPWLFFPASNTSLLALMMLVMLGASSGGMAGLASSRRAIFSFITPMLLGLASALLWLGGTVYTFLGVAVLIYMVANVKFGLKQNQLLADSLHTRYEKEALAQSLQEQVRKVEKVSAEKTRFLASASHDLRQPLHSLGLFGAAISARLRGTPDEPLAHNLMLCVNALDASFSAMLDISKIDAGVVQAKPQPVALADIFRRLHASYGEYAQAQGLALRFKPGGRWVMADAVLLERVLGNLVHNAIKFTQTGGVVLVARQRGQQVCVQVWDTGCGVAPTELPHIFEEFYQVGNTQRDRAKGLGMGLAIVQRLADLMGVAVNVVSRPARGTRFELLLPASAAVPVVLPGPLLAPPEFQRLEGLCVLVIDDEESVRLSTAAVLSLYGVTVHLADGLKQAHAVADRLGAGLGAVIADFRLGDQTTGPDLVAALRALHRHRHNRYLPALLITGDTAPERVRQAQQSALRVLYKPVKADELAQALCVELRPTK
jgi:signal transduction histidine kinase/CheY-like chemotaxis protein